MARTTEITSQRKTGIGHEVLGFKNAYVISLREAPITPKRRLQIAQGRIERETAKSKAPPHTVDRWSHRTYSRTQDNNKRWTDP